MSQREMRWKGFKWKGLQLLVIVLLAMGIFFRFTNIGMKVAWIDEIITLLRISDTSEQTIYTALASQEITVTTLHDSLEVNPQQTGVGVIDVISNNLVKAPEHPPLYYVIARLWAEWFGNSVAVARSVAAVLSLFVFPCIYWLCWELFGSALAAWVGVAVVAVSPLYVLYAQEARQYSLFTVMILLSSATLLRAIRTNTTLSWITYAAALTMGLYTNFFFALVAIAQGVYTVLIESFRLSRTLVRYGLAALAGFIVYTPWLWLFISQSSDRQDKASWAVQNPSLVTMAKRWIGSISRIFLDLGFDESTPTIQVFLATPLFLGLILLVGYSIYFLCRHAPKRAWLFVLTLIGITTVPLVVFDIVSGTIFSATTRYLFPFYVAIQLAVIYLFASKIIAPVSSIRQRRVWQFVLLAVLSSGILSCMLISQAQVWWSKGESKEHVQIAAIVNQSSEPVLISDGYLGHVLPLSYLLHPNTRVQLELEPNVSEIPSGDVFLLNPSDEMQQALEQEHTIEPLHDEKLELWELDVNE